MRQRYDPVKAAFNSRIDELDKNLSRERMMLGRAKSQRDEVRGQLAITTKDLDDLLLVRHDLEVELEIQADVRDALVRDNAALVEEIEVLRDELDRRVQP